MTQHWKLNVISRGENNEWGFGGKAPNENFLENMAFSDNILTLTYDFLLYLIPELSKYPRDQKFLLGDRIETLALDILDDFIIAYYSKQKLERLQEANLKLERLRYLIRLSQDLKLLSNKLLACELQN